MKQFSDFDTRWRHTEYCFHFCHCFCLFLSSLISSLKVRIPLTTAMLTEIFQEFTVIPGEFQNEIINESWPLACTFLQYAQQSVCRGILSLKAWTVATSSAENYEWPKWKVELRKKTFHNNCEKFIKSLQPNIYSLFQCCVPHALLYTDYSDIKGSNKNGKTLYYTLLLYSLHSNPKDEQDIFRASSPLRALWKSSNLQKKKKSMVAWFGILKSKRK